MDMGRILGRSSAPARQAAAPSLMQKRSGGNSKATVESVRGEYSKYGWVLSAVVDPFY